MTGRLRRAIAAASVTLALLGGLAGCASGPGISDERAGGYRAQVVAIAELSSTGAYADALAQLEALSAQVEAAAADGSLDADRAAEITDALALVRADLEAAIAEAATPEPAPEATDDSGNDANDDDPGNSGSNSGSGNGNGNSDDKPGKGNGRDKGGKDD